MLNTSNTTFQPDEEDREALIQETRRTALLNEYAGAVERGLEATKAEISETFQEEFGMTPEEAGRSQAPRVERAVRQPTETAVPQDQTPRKAAAKKTTARAIRGGKA